jgi:hypothetical protein
VQEEKELTVCEVKFVSQNTVSVSVELADQVVEGKSNATLGHKES